jgi:tRNA (guanine26-N2/guanine27-N2)-dimethyltransferase
MRYPADQELSVFYNPVQVQNRDLSILMIALYAERRAIRKAVVQKKKELLKQQQQLEHDQEQHAPISTTNGEESFPRKKIQVTKEERKYQEEKLLQQVKDYEKSLNGRELVLKLEQQEQDATNDMTIEGLTILDALAASGLRSMRYWKEIPGVKHVTINDLETAAVERAHANLQHNQLQTVVLSESTTRQRGICIQQGDATHEMYLSRRPQQQLKNTGSSSTTPEGDLLQQHTQKPMWDVIDLDPYGSAAPFLDGAVQSVEHGGLLCITCTDMAALGGSHPETAYGRYAALPIQSAPYLQELALRLLLHTIATSAARYGRTIRPVLSVGMAFYVRVFVEVYDDKKGVSELSLNIGQVYQSSHCPTFFTLPHGVLGGKKHNVYQSSRLVPAKCPETGAAFKIGGPLWLGPLHDPTVVQAALDRLVGNQEEESSTKKEKETVDQPTTSTSKTLNIQLLATKDRLIGLLSSVREELHDGAPLYYTLPSLCKTLHVTSPPLKSVMAAIHNAGYQVSGYHKEPVAIKTNAPSSVVWDVLRAWAKQYPPTKTPLETSAAHKILAVEPSITVDFTIPKNVAWIGSGGGTTTTHTTGVARFPLNPTKNWGPKPKATNKTTTTTPPDHHSKRKYSSEGDEKNFLQEEQADTANGEEPSIKKVATETNSSTSK